MFPAVVSWVNLLVCPPVVHTHSACQWLLWSGLFLIALFWHCLSLRQPQQTFMDVSHHWPYWLASLGTVLLHIGGLVRAYPALVWDEWCPVMFMASDDFKKCGVVKEGRNTMFRSSMTVCICLLVSEHVSFCHCLCVFPWMSRLNVLAKCCTVMCVAKWDGWNIKLIPDYTFLSPPHYKAQHHTNFWTGTPRATNWKDLVAPAQN